MDIGTRIKVIGNRSNALKYSYTHGEEGTVFESYNHGAVVRLDNPKYEHDYFYFFSELKILR